MQIRDIEGLNCTMVTSSDMNSEEYFPNRIVLCNKEKESQIKFKKLRKIFRQTDFDIDFYPLSETVS